MGSEKALPPFITVGLPTYNRPEFTRLAIQSCLEQDYPHFEIIVSDDSPDGRVREAAESFRSDKVRYYKNEPALGIPAKLNDLVEKARGPWMVLLGDDDLFEPGYLSTVAGHLTRHPEAALVHTRCRQIDEKGTWLHTDKEQKPEMSPAELLHAVFRPWYEMRVSITGFVFPVETMKRLGGFRDFYMGYYCDNLAWAMLGAQGTSYFDPAPLTTLRENASSISRAFVPDYRRLIASREETVRLLSRLFDETAGRTKDAEERKKLEAARGQCMECVLEDTRDFLDRTLVQLFKGKNEGTAAGVREIFAAMEKSELPLFASARFLRLVRYYRRISSWPPLLRQAAFGTARALKKARILVRGPHTLPEKAHYRRIRLRKRRS